jgi:hypothetical protein
MAVQRLHVLLHLENSAQHQAADRARRVSGVHWNEDKRGVNVIFLQNLW